MIAGIQSALSSLQAFATKTENNANNIANMNTGGFKKDRVVLSALSPQGVKATLEQGALGASVVESTDEGSNMIEQSNVDLGQEIPEMLLNKIGYTANLKTLQTADQMMQSVLDIKA